jgi:hypothetical protein
VLCVSRFRFVTPYISNMFIVSSFKLRWADHVARMVKNSMPTRLMYVQTEGLRKVGRTRARWRDEVGKTKDAGIKELMNNSHESWRVEETSEGDQDSLWVVVPMMMMMI